MQQIQELKSYISRFILGQEELVERLLIALLCDGHLLVEGAPGLAKTRAIKVMGQGLEGDFQRIQFTPDLLPSDLTGTEIYRPNEGKFQFETGPLFHNLILADEINRAPAKVQSALLEAMEERQITVGSETYPLPRLYLVMATQNPIEQEGTYPLPEAQMDRFLIHVRIGYPSGDSEREILRLNRKEAKALHDGDKPEAMMVNQETIFAARQEVLAIHMADELEDYILNIVLATRDASAYGEDISRAIQYGASPRATIALDRCARARAWLDGRDFVSPEDVQAMAPDVLRHRIILNFEAEAEGITPDDMIQAILQRVGVP
ncbi:MAG: AAA family ATPase [Gammaproteobacteria bacterium]